MAQGSRETMLSADRPLTDPALDRIGRARFARHIANAVALAPPEGLVMGLHGGPGSGKTTVAQFVRAELAEAPGTVVLEFNPWLHDDPDLGLIFLSVLHSAVSGGDSDAGGQRANLLVARDRLAGLLAQESTRYVVIIDDVDRLTDARRAELGRVVRLVAALPGVVHLLVFDRGAVPDDEVGRLVQVPFDIPLPEPGAVGQIFLDEVRELLERYPPAPVVTEHHWRQIYSPGIEAILETPRDVNRLLNVLRLSYPPVSSEINAADFIAIEALRVFLPRIYELIRNTPQRFTGATRARTALTADAELQEFHDAWVQELPEQTRIEIITLMLRLFPAVPDQPALVIVRDPPGENTRAELRIADPELFSIYFQFVVPGGIVSNADLEAYMAEAADPARFASLLRRLGSERDAAGTPRLGAVLERMRDVAPEITPQTAANVVEALLAAGDELGLVGDRATRDLVWALLRRLPESDRASLLERQVPTCSATATAVWLVAELGLEHGHGGGSRDLPEDDRMVTLDHLVELEQAGLRAIRSAASSGRLLALPGLAMVFACWQRWDRPECVRWVTEASTDDDALVAIIAAHLVRVRDTGSDLGTQGAYRLDPEAIRPLISPDVIANRVRSLAREGRGGEAQIALDQFVAEYDQRQAETG